MANRKRKTTQLKTTEKGSKRSRLTDIEQCPGTVNRMIVKNFMCHSLLEVEFLNNISIITGRNGSGKSAILTALIVGLGGKANLTNRGNSVKNFIKAGRTHCSIEIELYNGTNPISYRPEIYGERIKITRYLNSNGSSIYTIKNDSGKTISKSVKELKNILTAFNIQIDNPICILNQDTSRNFLNSNNPKHKFQLFIKATQLDVLFEEYQTINMNKVEAIRELSDKEKNLKKLTLEMEQLKDKIDSHRKIKDQRQMLKNFKVELFWAKVRDSETELEHCQQQYDDLKQQYQTILNKSNDRNERIETIMKNIKSLERQIKELQDNSITQLRPCTNIQRLLQELKQELNEKRKNKQMLQNTIETKTGNVNIIKEQIVHYNEDIERVEREKTERLTNLTNLEEELKSLEEHLQTCRNELYQIRNDVQRLDEEKSNLRQELEQIDRKIHNEQSSCTALQNESTNTLLLYGREMPRIKQIIEQNKDRFKHVPCGPLGTYIRLKDKKWAIAIESFIGRGLLNAFIVDNIDDNRLLRQIFEKNYTTGTYPTIITSKFIFKKHEIWRNLVIAPDDCLSFYDALDIQDPIVNNCLIDQLQIERVLLVPNDKRAIDLMSNYQNVPKNCQQTITQNGDRYYPDPNYRTYSVRFNNRVMYLQTNKKDIINDIKDSIQKYQQKKNGFKQQIQQLNKQIDDQQSKKVQLEEKIKKFNCNKVQLNRQLDELKSRPEPEVANVKVLENELNDIQTLISQKTIQIQNIDEEIKKIRESIVENQEKLQELQKQNRDLENRINNLNTEIKDNTIRSKELETEDKYEKRRLGELKQQLNDLKTTTLNSLKEEVQSFTIEASGLGERINTNRKIQIIMNDIRDYDRQINRLERETENVENIEKNYKQLRIKLEKASIVLQQLSGIVKQQTQLVELRRKFYKITEDYFITCVKFTFKRFMEMRKFNGDININVDQKLLDIVVIPKEQQQKLTKNATTTNLSGGERSFSTIAFLYSLWQCMEFPFYFLDEFDVYMDKLNRTQVINILIEHAKMHPSLQFVFLTPQDVSFVDKTVNILRMEDPAKSS